MLRRFIEWFVKRRYGAELVDRELVDTLRAGYDAAERSTQRLQRQHDRLLIENEKLRMMVLRGGKR